MVNNTVNGKKIGDAAGKNDKIRIQYASFGKKEVTQEMDIGNHATNLLIDNLRKNGEIVNETTQYIAIKTYPGGNPNKTKSKKVQKKSSDDITH